MSSEPNSVAIGDLRGIGVLDLITVNDNSTVSVLLANGTGNFQVQPPFGVGDDPLSIALGDLTGDGVLDFVTANSNDNDISVALGQTP